MAASRAHASADVAKFLLRCVSTISQSHFLFSNNSAKYQPILITFVYDIPKKRDSRKISGNNSHKARLNFCELLPVLGEGSNPIPTS